MAVVTLLTLASFFLQQGARLSQDHQMSVIKAIMESHAVVPDVIDVAPTSPIVVIPNENSSCACALYSDMCVYLFCCLQLLYRYFMTVGSM